MKSFFSFTTLSSINLYLLALLVPLWFLPFTQNSVEYPKQLLVIILIFLSIAAWGIKVIRGGELSYRRTWLYIPLFFLLLVSAVSTFFSLSPSASFWGSQFDIAGSFLTLSAFVFLYLVMVNTLNVKSVYRFLALFAVSSAAASMLAVAQLGGLLSFLPFGIVSAPAFNTIGSLNSVAVFSAVLLPFSLGMALGGRMLSKIFLWIVVSSLVAVLVLINFSTAWITLIVGMITLFILGMSRMRSRNRLGWVSFPFTFSVIALLFLLFSVSVPGAPSVPFEVSPSQKASFDIAQNVLADRPFLGSGPGTFVFDYARFRSPVLNQTLFWGTRFPAGASEVLDGFAERGVLGMLAFFGMVFAALAVGIRKFFFPHPARHDIKDDRSFAGIQSESQQEAERSEEAPPGEQSGFSLLISYGIFASFVAVLTAQFLYPAHFMLSLIFWMLLGGMTVIAAPRLRSIALKKHTLFSTLPSFVFLFVIIFGLGLIFVGAQKYVAEIHYRRALNIYAQGNIDSAINQVLSATRLNPSSDVYWRNLSQLYLVRLNQITQNAGISLEERQERSQDVIANIVASTRQATDLSPADVANWTVQGFVYRSLIGIPGAEDFAIEAYRRAIELEPASPFNWTELGRIYFLQAQRRVQEGASLQDQEKAYEQAFVNLNQALELKEDYAPAHYLAAVVYDSQGRTAEAVVKLKEATAFSPRDVGLAFQLGMVYWQQGEIEGARVEFERAKALNPSYSNARYMLGLVYDTLGEPGKARLEFAVVAGLNPGNLEVLEILKNLNAGRSALESITPNQPPIQEIPFEISEE